MITRQPKPLSPHLQEIVRATAVWRLQQIGITDNPWALEREEAELRRILNKYR